MKNTSLIKFKCATPLAMLYISIALADISLVYRLTSIQHRVVTVGVFIMPFYYFIEDMMAELYGYQLFKKIIWSGLACGFIFSIIITLAIHLPTVSFTTNNHDYLVVFDHLLRTMIGGGCIAVTSGAFVNSYLVARWKILSRGRYFWLRSVGSSAIGQGVQVAIGSLLLYSGVFQFSKIIHMILPIYLTQILLSAIIAIPGLLIVNLLKLYEGVNLLDTNLVFNPFNLNESQIDT